MSNPTPEELMSAFDNRLDYSNVLDGIANKHRGSKSTFKIESHLTEEVKDSIRCYKNPKKLDDSDHEKYIKEFEEEVKAVIDVIYLGTGEGMFLKETEMPSWFVERIQKDLVEDTLIDDPERIKKELETFRDNFPKNLVHMYSHALELEEVDKVDEKDITEEEYRYKTDSEYGAEKARYRMEFFYLYLLATKRNQLYLNCFKNVVSKLTKMTRFMDLVGNNQWEKISFPED
jgi:hypothetical protein